MNDNFRRFDAELPSTQADFRVTESYRAVRIGLYFMIAGYLLFVPGFAFLIIFQQQIIGNNADPINLILGIAGVVACLLLIMIGGFFLRKSPQYNERAFVNKFLIAILVSIGCIILKRTLGIKAFDIVKSIAQAYGTYFLINFLQVLAVNRQNDALKKSSKLLGNCYNIGLLALLSLVFVGPALGNAVTVVLMAVAVFFVVFYYLWIRTLWIAIKATGFIASDAVRDYLD